MKTPILFYILLLILSASCVSSKKYKELDAQYQKSLMLEKSYETKNENLKLENEDLKDEIAGLKSENAKIKQELFLQNEANLMNLKEFQVKYDKLYEAYNQLMQNSSTESNAHRLTITQKELELAYINQEKNQTIHPQNYPTYTSQNIQTSINTKAELLDLQKQLIRILSNFSEEDLSIELQNNQVYVFLADELLFANPQYDFKEKGLYALQSLTSAIKGRTDLEIALASEAENAEGKLSAYQKAEAIAKVFQQGNLNPVLHEKNFAPLAFDTSGTKIKKTKSLVMLKLR